MTICEKHIHVKKKGCKECEQEWKEQTAASQVIRAEFTPREWDTVLAALRLWQHDSAHIADGDGALADMAQEHGDPLTNEEVDDLCERINCPPEPHTPITRRYIAQVLPIGTGRTITIDVIGDERTHEDESMHIAEEFARKKLKAKSMRVSQWTKPVEGSYREKADYVTGPGR
jgi:hypothetical protein